MLNINQSQSSVNSFQDKLSSIAVQSQLISFISFPFQECYKNFKNIFNNEYPVRSGIRFLCSFLGIISGPLLIHFGNFAWLEGLSLSLFNAIPVFNLLPASLGIIICSAYISGYISAWGINQITNLFNAANENDLSKYFTNNIEHYLTEESSENIINLIKSTGINITVNEVKDIFNKINELRSINPKNPVFLNMIKAIRTGDFQTILDNAVLLETELALIDKKIIALQRAHPLTPYAPPNTPNNRTFSLETNMNYIPLQPNAIIYQYHKHKLTTHENNQNRTPNYPANISHPYATVATIESLEQHKNTLERARFVPRSVINNLYL
jgi:hypothetical protein